MSNLVLVVDDEPDVRDLFAQRFRRELRSGRFAMDFALSAQDALRQIADVRDRNLILVLSDINMPHLTGLELLPKIKQMVPDVPVVMITAYGDDETRRKAVASGASGLIPKPIDFAALRAEIDARIEPAA